MNGNFIPSEEADPFAKEFLVALKRPASLRDKCLVDFSVTPKEHSQAWKV